MFKKALCATLSACALLLSSASQAAPYTGMYVFGDSLSDSGNFSIATGGAFPGPANAYTQGRFTNAFNFIDAFATAMGMSAAPSVLGGSNFAWGGARTTTHPLFPFASIQAQVAGFVARPGAADPHSLYVLFGGANNVRDAILAANPLAAVAAANDLKSSLDTLYAEGARRFLVPNIPNIARTPAIAEFANPAISGFATALSNLFNNTLEANLAMFEGAHMDVEVRRLDTYAFLEQLLASAAALGFTNVDSRCYTGDDAFFTTPPAVVPALTCANPDSYVFWDGVHPTSAVHGLFGQAAVAAVPEPGGLALLALALVILVMVRRHAAASPRA